MRLRRPLVICALVLLAALQAACVGGLRLVWLQVPQYRLRGEAALLRCLYDLGGDALSSVQWYKDGQQFYRYLPRAHPPQHSYHVDGVRVDHQRSDDQKVLLLGLSLRSAGDYRCEVSAGAPSFASAQAERHMEVVALPKDGPRIQGEQRLFQVGDDLSLNCSSGKSHPASQLKWFINDQQVRDDDPRLEVFPAERDARGLLTSRLGLRFAVSGAHFASGSLRLRCVAEVAPLLWRADRESVLQRLGPPREALFLVHGGSSRPLAATTAALAALLIRAVT